MSRLANVPIKIPSSVTVSVEKQENTHSLTISNGKVTETGYCIMRLFQLLMSQINHYL